MTGLLYKIEYPTRRAVEYTYESHDYHTISPELAGYYKENMDNGNFNHIAEPFVSGGLRVKSLKEISRTEKVRNFNYDIDGNSSGELTATPFNHTHNTYGHKSSGNHHIYYKKVEITEN